MTRQTFADRMTEAGFPTKLSDVRNATQLPFVPNSVPRTPIVLKAIESLQDLFPGISVDVLLVPETQQRPPMR